MSRRQIATVRAIVVDAGAGSSRSRGGGVANGTRSSISRRDVVDAGGATVLDRVPHVVGVNAIPTKCRRNERESQRRKLFRRQRGDGSARQRHRVGAVERFDTCAFEARQIAMQRLGHEAREVRADLAQREVAGRVRAQIAGQPPVECIITDERTQLRKILRERAGDPREVRVPIDTHPRRRIDAGLAHELAHVIERCRADGRVVKSTQLLLELACQRSEGYPRSARRAGSARFRALLRRTERQVRAFFEVRLEKGTRLPVRGFQGACRESERG
jgi:hypothetical protein